MRTFVSLFFYFGLAKFRCNFAFKFPKKGETCISNARTAEEQLFVLLLSVAKGKKNCLWGQMRPDFFLGR